MPKPKREMSWLSPKRRRTTGNLKIIPTSQAANGSNETSATPNAEDARPTIPERIPSTPTPSSSKTPPPSAIRPAVRANLLSTNEDGNLFYAYARKGDDAQPHYLLTFASARVAKEWWLLLQTHFPDCSRPGPQLFRFDDADLLPKAWIHPSFTQLQIKWMYTPLGDAGTDGLGRPMQSIIPVQDADGNLLGGSAPAGLELGQVRRGTQTVCSEIIGLREHLEKMMQAVERNTEQVANIAAKRQHAGHDEGSIQGRGDYFDLADLSSHLGRVNDILSRSQEHFEGLSRRQFEHDQKLQATIQDLASRNQRGSPIIAQLSEHLDKLHDVVEQSINRRDSARELSESRNTKIDFSPLIGRLDKVQEAVEQNSALLRALLEEGTAIPDKTTETSLWSRATPQVAPFDLSSLMGELQKIHTAIEQQSEHVRDLVEFASGKGGSSAPVSGGETAEKSLLPLSEHLKQIRRVIEEGNALARSLPKLDGQLDQVDATLSSGADYLQQLVDKFDGALKTESQSVSAGVGVDKLSEVNQHLVSLREWTEFDSEQLKELVDGQKVIQSTLKDNNNKVVVESLTEKLSQILTAQRHPTRFPAPKIDLAPITTYLARIHTFLLEHQQPATQSTSPGSGDPKFLLSALTSHLSKIQAVTEINATHLHSLSTHQSTSQDKMHVAVVQTADQIRAVSARQVDIEERLEATNRHLEELVEGLKGVVEGLGEVKRGRERERVVFPPPRKMGKKILGFVYEGQNSSSSGAGEEGRRT